MIGSSAMMITQMFTDTNKAQNIDTMAEPAIKTNGKRISAPIILSIGNTPIVLFLSIWFFGVV